MSLLFFMLFSQKFTVGDCLKLDNALENVKIMEVTEEEYITHYWMPWLYKYVPQFYIRFDEIDKYKVEKVKCLKERPIKPKTENTEE